MDQQLVNQLLCENMQNIFSFSLSRLSNRQDAEDLTSDILVEVLRSANQIRDEERFFGFLWRVARNLYADVLKKRQKQDHGELLEDGVMSEEHPVEDEIVFRENMKCLRRELSLLSDIYRRSIVLYYFENLSCRQIAEKIGVSTEMVKYHLFRARNIIREGMNMERILGEKSYRPHSFEIDFWGTKAGDSAEYKSFQNRKLRGNILLSAYYAPISIQDLSLELGVAVPYLEDEIHLLEDRQYLIQKSGKYLTNIPIFTMECTNEIQNRTGEVIENAANAIIEGLDEQFGKEYGERFGDVNLLRWQAIMLCCHFAMLNTDNDLAKKYGPLPSDGPYSLINGGGGKGIIWGRCAKEGNLPEHDFEGVYNGCPSMDHRGSLIAFNFRQTLNAQHCENNMVDPIVCIGSGCWEYLPEPWKARMETLSYVKNGKPNFPVYTSEEYDRLTDVLENAIGIFTEMIRKTRCISAAVSADHAPDHIRKTAEYSGALVYQFVSLHKIADKLYDCGWLKSVQNTDKPTMCVVVSK